MTGYSIDLHNHTPLLNDYRGSLDTSPGQIVRHALTLGLDLYAVTDHLSLDFYRRLERAAEVEFGRSGRRLLVLPGVEVRAGRQNNEAHVVAVFPLDAPEERVADLFAAIRFDPAAVPVEHFHAHVLGLDPSDVAQAVVDLGGTAHLGHVDRCFGAYRLLDSPSFDELAHHPAITAIDVVDLAHVPDIERRAPGKAIIQSSDSHALDEMARRRITLPMKDLSYDALAEALKPAAVRIPATA